MFMFSLVGYYTIGTTTLKVKFSVVRCLLFSLVMSESKEYVVVVVFKVFSKFQLIKTF